MRCVLFRFIIFLPILFSATLCVAQEDSSDHISLSDVFDPMDEEPKIFQGGLTFGANITQVDGDTYAGYHKVGIHAGGLVRVNFTPKFAISMELLYAQKGARGGAVHESLTVGTYIDKYYLNLNYVEVPLVFHYKWMVFFDFEAGFSYSRLVKSKEWAEADVPVFLDPVLGQFNSNDLNYLAGCTVRLGKHWYGGARMQYSVVPVRPWERVHPRYGTVGVGQYNNVVVFRMIYML